MRKRARLLLLLAVALAGAGIAAAGVLPQGFATVGDVAAHPQQYRGEVHVKAIVAEGSVQRAPGEVRFAITDGAATLPVHYQGSLPDAFGSGRDVVVSGMLIERAGGAVLEATSIQGGCASKYEPAPGAGA
jgi:cytochrome c-type biogenesis protein CcmE